MSFTSVDALSDRLAVITSAPVPPNPRSARYVWDTTETVADDGSPDKLRDVRTLLGVHLVVEAKQPDGKPSPLYDGLFPKASSLDPQALPTRKKELIIICDALELRSPIWVPEARITIYARKLRIHSDAYVRTTPLPWVQGKEKARKAQEVGASGENGVDGRHAGPIALWARQVIVDNATGPTIAFEARGGDGQHAGEGKDGGDGTSARDGLGAVQKPFASRHYATAEQLFFSQPETHYNMKFDPPALYAHLRIKGLEFITLDDQYYGIQQWPTNGEPASPPGRPGDSGAGGPFLTNQDGLHALVDNAGGKAGHPAPGAKGGKKGLPAERCAHYELVGYHNSLGRADAKIDYTCRENPNGLPKDGADAPAPAFAPTVRGSAGGRLHAIPSAWVHPLLLQSVLTYARDAYLAEQRALVRELLEDYNAALLADEHAPRAPTFPESPWHDGNEELWRSAGCEVASLLRRLDARLDYFANPAGYMPLLSLQSALDRYNMKIETAIRALLLSGWSRQKQGELSVQHAAGNAAIQLLQESTGALSKGLANARASADQLLKDLKEIRAQQELVSASIEHERVRLLQQASAEEREKAQWKAGLNIASALLHVFPYGQPALGTAGDAVATLGEKWIDGEGPGDLLSSAGTGFEKVLGEYEKAAAAAEKDAETAASDAEKRAKRDDGKFSNKDFDLAKAKAKAEVSEISVALNGVGPALSKVGKAVSLLQVPESKIQAKLEELQKKSPEFQRLSTELSSLIERKTRFAADLTSTLRLLGDDYSRLAANARGITMMERRVATSAARLDPEAFLFMGRLEQEARASLVAAIYTIVKAYETTLFRPMQSVDWRVDQLVNQVASILQDPKNTQTAEGLLAQAKVLQVQFEQGLDRIREDLINNYRFGNDDEQSLGYLLSAAKLERLKDAETVTIDPVRKGLNLENRERAFLFDVQIEELEFIGDLPASGNAEIKLRVGDKGIVRVDGKLFGVRRDAPAEWTWIYDFAGRRLLPSKPSVRSESLLNWVLQSKQGSRDEKAQQMKAKLSLPPAWSNLLLRVRCPALDGRTLKLAKLRFQFQIDSLPADENDCVLEMRCDDPSQMMVCSAADRGGQDRGRGQIYGIYRKDTMVELSLDQSARGTPDRPAVLQLGWSVPNTAMVQTPSREGSWTAASDRVLEIGGKPTRFILSPRIRIKMDKHAKVRCVTTKPDDSAE